MYTIHKLPVCYVQVKFDKFGLFSLTESHIYGVEFL